MAWAKPRGGAFGFEGCPGSGEPSEEDEDEEEEDEGPDDPLPGSSSLASFIT